MQMSSPHIVSIDTANSVNLKKTVLYRLASDVCYETKLVLLQSFLKKTLLYLLSSDEYCETL